MSLFGVLIKIREWGISFFIQRPMLNVSKCSDRISLSRCLREHLKTISLSFPPCLSVSLSFSWPLKSTMKEKMNTLLSAPKNHIPGGKDG